MSDPLVPWLLTALAALASTVATMAVFIYRVEVKRREAAEEKLREYEAPALEAAREVRLLSQELLKRAGMEHRAREAADPWSVLDSSPRRTGPTRRKRP